MHPIPSASGLDRALACPLSEVLPHTPDTGSRDADRGTDLHAHCERMGRGMPVAASLALVPAEHRADAEGIDLPAIVEALGYDPFGDQEVHHEIALAYDLTSGDARVLGCGLERDYGAATDTEAVGTADIAIVDRAAGTLTLADYKMGHGDVPRARVNAQVRSLALYACRAFDLPRAVVAVIRLRPDGTAWIDRDTMETIHLADQAMRLADLRERIARLRAGTAQADPVTGPHCRYCRAAPSCPAGPLALTLRQGTGLDRLAATPEGRLHLLQLATLAKRLPDLIEERLRACIDAGETELPDGLRLALEAKETPKVADHDLAFQAVAIEIGATAADTAVPLVRHATLSAIDKAASAARVKGEKADAAKARVRARLAAAGALKVSITETVVAR